MKPFDLEQAKLGKPVCTREGKKVVIYDFEANNDFDSIAGKVLDYYKTSNKVTTWHPDGKYMANDAHELDLFMAFEKKEGWVNVCDGDEGKEAGFEIYESERDAELSGSDSKYFIATCKITWEE